MRVPEPIPDEVPAPKPLPDLRVIKTHRTAPSRFRREVLLTEELPDLDPLDPLFPLYEDLWTRDGRVSHAVVRYLDRRGRVRLATESWAPSWLIPVELLAKSEMRYLKRWLSRQAISLEMKPFGVWEEIFDVFHEREQKEDLLDLFPETCRQEDDPYRFRTLVCFDSRLVLAQYLVQPDDAEPIRWRWEW